MAPKAMKKSIGGASAAQKVQKTEQKKSSSQKACQNVQFDVFFDAFLGSVSEPNHRQDLEPD